MSALGVTDRPSAGARQPTDEEPKFTGLNQGEIPSKSFQRLQSMTGAGMYSVTILVVINVIVVRVISRSLAL